jgi:DNA-binding CsgD family transcriptional regulator
VTALAWTAPLAIDAGRFGALKLRLIGGSSPPSPQLLIVTVVEVTFVAGTFPFAVRRLRGFPNRLPFHDVDDVVATLQELGYEIVRMTRGSEITRRVLERLGTIRDLSWAAIFLYPRDAPALLYRWGDCPTALGASPRALGYLRALMKLGVRGFLPRIAGDREIVAAVRAVAEGQPVVIGQTARTALEDEPVELTTREYEGLQLIARGHRNSEVAEMLSISPKTVEFHVGQLPRKQRAQSRSEAISKARRSDLIAPAVAP